MKMIALILLIALLGVSLACGSRTADPATLSTQVKERLAADSDTKDLKLSVEVSGEVVTLTGNATTEIEKEKAEQIASHTEGVTRVVNNIKVHSLPSTPTPSATSKP